VGKANGIIIKLHYSVSITDFLPAFEIGIESLISFNGFAGAPVVVFTRRFIITGADLFVYNYMETNPEYFPPNVIDNIRNYMIQAGHLKEDNAGSLCDTENENKECKNNLVC
jgi:hypothetical protein